MIEGVRILKPVISRPEEVLLRFRKLQEEGVAVATVFDLARFPDQTLWSFVSDGINRSGVNPLRGLGTLLREPFPDVSRLYRVPDGFQGVEMLALGNRYPAPPVGRPVCGHLQSLAVLAHTEGLVVSGVVVAESRLPEFEIGQLLPGAGLVM